MENPSRARGRSRIIYVGPFQWAGEVIGAPELRVKYGDFTNVEPSIVKKGMGMGLWAYPVFNDKRQLVANPLFPDLPNYVDILKKVKGSLPRSTPHWKVWELVLSFTDMGHTM